MRESREVFGRLMALRALLWRTQFELHLNQGAPHSAIAKPHDELVRWMKAATIRFSPRERELIDGARLGSWPQPQIAELVWRNEAAAVLLWALDLVPNLPPYFVVIPAAAIMQQLERLPQLAQDPPPLRPQAELTRELEHAEMWNWRARTESLRRSGAEAPPGDSFDATVARAASAAVDAKLVAPAMVEAGDFIVGNEKLRYADAPDPLKRQLACVAHERHWAMAWLMDRQTAWDTVNPST